jgi:hypothetical protein
VNVDLNNIHSSDVKMSQVLDDLEGGWERAE